jgi:PhnB protein
MAKPIPEGYTTVTPVLVLNDAARAIDFYKRAFGAKELMRSTHGGKVAHAELQIGNSRLMLHDEWPGTPARSPQSLGGTAVGIWLYVEDVDKLFNQAVQAGAKVNMPVTNQFWGDRFANVTDPFGHMWSLATHVEDVAPDELERRAKEAMAKMAGGGQSGA